MDKFFERFSIELDALLVAFAAEPDTLSGASLRPLMQTPLVKLPAVTIAPYPRYLRNLLGAGLYFVLMDAYRHAAGNDKKAKKESVERFTRFFGEFFEDYVVQLFADSYFLEGASQFGELHIRTASNRRTL